MRRFAPIALLAACCALAGSALAFDNGQYENVPAELRAWFKGVMAPNGVPCSTSPTAYQPNIFSRRPYWVPIKASDGVPRARDHS